MIEASAPAQTWGLGKVFLQPRHAAEIAYAHGFTDALDLATIVAIGGAESQWGVDAWHDNFGADGTRLSRDVGWLQINIPASEIGTAKEQDLYDPNTNAARARALYLMPAGEDVRAFQPWAAYNSGVYLHETYAGKAVLGVMNFAVERLRSAGSPLPLPLFSTHDLAAKLR